MKTPEAKSLESSWGRGLALFPDATGETIAKWWGNRKRQHHTESRSDPKDGSRRLKWQLIDIEVDV